MNMESSETYSSPEKSDEEKATNKKKKNHPRRFTDEQIKSLESIFKQETKLEPRNKLQIAKDLDLQPRQVAIWFQNKRARWKSKQIEHEYRLLKSTYDTLSIRFDDLKREKHSLQMQLQQLKDKLKNQDNVNRIEDDDEKKKKKKKNILTSCFVGTEDQEQVSWSEEEEEMSQTWRNLSASFENPDWWEG